MKSTGSRQTAQREIFVLTSEEKSTICFVLIMFLLGITAARYRTAHSVPLSKIAVNQTATTTDRPAQRRAESKHRSPPR
jgi:hypothetical protein